MGCCPPATTTATPASRVATPRSSCRARRGRAEPADPHLQGCGVRTRRRTHDHRRQLLTTTGSATSTSQQLRLPPVLTDRHHYTTASPILELVRHVGGALAAGRHQCRRVRFGHPHGAGDGAVGQMRSRNNTYRAGRVQTQRRRTRRRQWRRAHARRRRPATAQEQATVGARGGLLILMGGARAQRPLYRHDHAERPRHWRSGRSNGTV